MAKKTITVPAAGKSKAFALTGLSVLVVSAPSYFSPTQAPELSFDNPGAGLPILNRSTYGSTSGKFNKVIVTGTAESAGDEIQLISVNACLETSLNINAWQTKKAQCGTTFSKVASDAVQGLSDLELVDENGNLPTAIYLSCTGGNIAYAFDANPDQAGFGHILTADKNPVEVEGIDFIKKFNFIDAVATTGAKLIISLEY